MISSASKCATAVGQMKVIAASRRILGIVEERRDVRFAGGFCIFFFLAFAFEDNTSGGGGRERRYMDIKPRFNITFFFLRGLVLGSRWRSRVLFLFSGGSKSFVKAFLWHECEWDSETMTRRSLRAGQQVTIFFVCLFFYYFGSSESPCEKPKLLRPLLC